MKFRLGSLFACLIVSVTPLAAQEIRFSGVVAMGSEKIVSLETRDGVRKWCAVGDRIGEFRVAQIRRDEQVVLVDRDGRESVVALQKAVIGQLQPAAPAKQLIPAGELDWKWIQSGENPMRNEPETIPEWAYVNWERLDEDIKIDLKNYYRAHGWDIQPRTVAPGRIHVRNVRMSDPSEPPPSMEERRKTAKPANLTPLTNNP